MPHDKKPMQAGARKYPEPPQPAQHQNPPGSEAALNPAPLYDAPHYLGSEKLAGMKAIITGGDSGIGRAVAVLFAREGADVAVIYLNEHDDAETTKKMVEKEGGACLTLAGDVGDLEFCRGAVERVRTELGGIDILVNNAAFQKHVGFDELSEEQFQKTVRTNLLGYFHMAKVCAPHLREGGSIINSGSVTGIEGSSHLIDYSATKGAIHSFTRSLSASLMERNVRVNAVAPGPVWTPLNPSDQSADRVAQFGADSKMGRAAQPEEIAPAYVFLASPQTASYITGEILPIIGGY